MVDYFLAELEVMAMLKFNKWGGFKGYLLVSVIEIVFLIVRLV